MRSFVQEWIRRKSCFEVISLEYILEKPRNDIGSPTPAGYDWQGDVTAQNGIVRNGFGGIGQGAAVDGEIFRNELTRQLRFHRPVYLAIPKDVIARVRAR